MESLTSRKYEKILKSGDCKEAVRQMIANKGIKGVVDVLEAVYERFGVCKDPEGQYLVECLVDEIEAANYFQPNLIPHAVKTTNLSCNNELISTKSRNNKSLEKTSVDLREGTRSPQKFEPKNISQDYSKELCEDHGKGKGSKSKKKDAKQNPIQNPEIIAEEKNQKVSKKPPQKVMWSEDEEEGFQNLDIQVVTSEDLQKLPMPEGFGKYLKLQDLNPKYRFVYLNKFDDDLIQEICKEFAGAEFVGLDSEFHLKNAKCSYVQISTPSFGAIFNIRNVEFRNHPVFKQHLRNLLESKTIFKIGHSLLQDLKVIRRAFFGDLEFKSFLSLEECLFTCRTNVLSLSGICKRLFGLPLNKEYQAWIGEQEEMETPEEQEYAIMDSLAPLMAYQKLKPFCDAKVQKGTFMVNCAQRDQIDKSEFMLDHHMELIRVFLERAGLKFSVLKEKTYEGTV